MLCDVKLRSPIKLDFSLYFYHQIQSRALDFANRRVNLRSVMHNCNKHGTVKRFWKKFQTVNELDANEFSPKFIPVCI
jgi:hypothetical protein